jgi:hypothetical protein
MVYVSTFPEFRKREKRVAWPVEIYRFGFTLTAVVAYLRNCATTQVTACGVKAWIGEPLLRELAGLWKFKVRRFHIVYEIDPKRPCSRFSPSVTGGREIV